MNSKHTLHGLGTALCTAVLTLLLVYQVQGNLHPFGLGLEPPATAWGYGASLTELCSNLEAYWKFDDGSGTSASDISENSHDGSLQNMQSSNWSTSVSSGLGFANTAALTFDGTEESVTVASDVGLQITGNLTLSLWVKYDALASASSGNVLLSHGTAGEAEAANILYQFSIEDDATLRLEWENGGGVDRVSESSDAASMVSGQWYHLAATRNSSTDEVSFYVDGSLLGAAIGGIIDPSGGTDGSLVIGAGADGMHYFDGSMDDVRIYTSVLTAAQILALADGTDTHAGCSCGNGSVESPEACDNGRSNSDTVADACRTSCATASCGDGAVDTGEECDSGNSNSNTVANACRTSCEAASCGDGVEDTGESCDDGNNVNTDSCTNSCTESTCGDEVLQEGEECDDGAANSDTLSNACRSTCELPSCGDGVVDLGETCDARTATVACDADCTVPVCGDGVANTAAGEACDNGGSNSDTVANACRSDCASASCGDGVADTGEACDDGNAANTDACTTVCRAAACGDGNIQTINNETCEPPNTGTCASNCNATTAGGGSNSRSRSTKGIIDLTAGNEEEEEMEQKEPPPEGCGNRILQTEKKEECDEGNRNGEGPCSYYCKLLYCGDGEISPEIYEECEPPSVSVKNGIPQFEEPVCGLNACSIPQINATTGRVIGGCKRLFLSPCEGEGEIVPAGVEEVVTVCGNGLLEVPQEECDDGNGESNDGCSSTCKEEGCGDGLVQTGEDCDNGSRCSNDSELQCTKDLDCGISLTCEEDGQGNKTCGGMPDGDPCVSEFDCSFFGTCQYLTEEDPSCSAECTFAGGAGTGAQVNACGNGVIGAGEECDDGNMLGGDGCSVFCMEERFCGDGTVDENEQCDDGNTQDGDGCSMLCMAEGSGGGGSEPAQETPEDVPHERTQERKVSRGICGNSVVEQGEECDFGSLNSDTTPNACRRDCANPYCGDMVMDSGEQCDDGTDNSNTRPNTCRKNCSLPSCGDGTIDTGEDCDSSNNCGQNCRFILLQSVCGNGARELTEDCDDGNTVSGDGCSLLCKVEPKILGLAVCGNGKKEGREQCDDGNLLDGDGCSLVCIMQAVTVVPLPQTQVAGENIVSQVPFPQEQPQEPVTQPQAQVQPQMIVFNQSSAGREQAQSFVAPMQQQTTIPQAAQVDSAQLNQWMLLAQLQQQYRQQLAQSIIPISAEHTPVGNTGPALLVVISAGAAAGVGYVRKKR